MMVPCQLLLAGLSVVVALLVSLSFLQPAIHITGLCPPLVQELDSFVDTFMLNAVNSTTGQ